MALPTAITDANHRAFTGTAADHFERVTPTPEQREMLSESHRDLCTGYPFLASLASSDSVFYHSINAPPDKMPIACTDGAAVYLNTAPGGWFDKKWTANQRMFVHAHEIMHIVREDVVMATVWRELGYVPVPRTPSEPDGRLPFKEDTLQKAMDGIINAGLSEDRVGDMLDGGFLHPKITWRTSTGEAYAILYHEDMQNPNKGKGPGGGQGGKGDPLGGDVRAPGSMGNPEGGDSPADSAPQPQGSALSKLQAGSGERQVMVKRAASAARMAGTGSSALEAMTEAAREPGIDWRSYIKGFLARSAGNSAYNWQRPARPPILRELIGEQTFFAPSRGGYGCNHVAFVGDTSGSIGEDEHRAMLSALCEMVRDLNPRYVSVTWCDSAVQRVDMFDGVPGEDALVDFYNHTPIPRGGGTDFKPPFKMFDVLGMGGTPKEAGNLPSHVLHSMLEASKPDGLIYFTDLYGDAPKEAPDYPVLWIVTTDMKQPWGERVGVDPQELVPRSSAARNRSRALDDIVNSPTFIVECMTKVGEIAGES